MTTPTFEVEDHDKKLKIISDPAAALLDVFVSVL